MSIAFVFPGQGAQTIGMGRDLAEAYPEARAVFQEVDDALGEKLSDLIWEGDIETLTLTQNAQPALMATSMAAMAALKAEGAEDVIAYVSHGVLSGGAVARVEASELLELVITDSIQGTDAVCNAQRVRHLPIAPLLGEAIKRIADESSVSSLFD